MSIYQTDKVLYPFCFRFLYHSQKLIRMYWLHGKHSKISQIEGNHHIVHSKTIPFWLKDAWEQIQHYLIGYRFSLNFPHEWIEQNPSNITAWKKLQTISYGRTISYKAFAQLASLKHPRIAGRVLSQNPFPLLYPCHRVIRSDKTLGGFTPDLSIKAYLLALEQHGNVH